MPTYTTYRNSLSLALEDGKQYVFRVKTTHDGQDYLSDWSAPMAAQSGGISWSDPPTSAGDPGNPGDVAYDDNYFYVYTQSGWRRSALGTWNPTITITTQPQNLALGEGDSGNFTIAATVDDGSTPSYQWQSSDDSGATWDTLTGSNSTTYSVSGVAASDNGTQYRAVVSSQGAANVTSSVATLTVGETFDLLVENGDRLMTEGGVSIDHDGAANGGGNDPGPEPSGDWELIPNTIYGASAASELGDLSLDSTGVTLAACERGGNVVRVFQDAGGGWEELSSQNFSITEPSSCAISGNGTLIAVESQGEVSVLEKAGTGWISYSSTGSNANSTYTESGQAVRISRDGSRVIFGTPVLFSGGAESEIIPGAVRVFETSQIESVYWVITVSNESVGSAVAINGDGSLIAFATHAPWTWMNYPAPELDQNGVYTYLWTGTSWVQLGSKIAGGSSEKFGRSISLSDENERLAVGAPYGDGGGTDRGYVRVFGWDGGEWVQLGQDINGDYDFDYAGWSVELSSDGNRVAVGIRGGDPAGSNSGQTRVYEYDGASWLQVGVSIDGVATNDYSGSFVSISGDGSRIGVGSPGADDGSQKINAGRVSVYELQDNQITITQQPQNVTYGGSPVVFSANATVSDNSSPSYLWQSSADNGSTWANLSGEASSSLTVSNITPSDDGNQYRAVISAARAPSTTTDNATLTVNENVLFSQQPQDTTVVAGNDATFSATLAPADNWYVYDMKWERADSGSPNSWNVVETEDIANYDISSSSAVALNYTWPAAGPFDDGDLFRATGAAFENALVQTSPTPTAIRTPQSGSVAWSFTVPYSENPYSIYWTAVSDGSLVATYRQLSQPHTTNKPPATLYVNGVQAETQDVDTTGSPQQVSAGDQIKINFTTLYFSETWEFTLQFTPAAGLQTQNVTSATATLNVT